MGAINFVDEEGGGEGRVEGVRHTHTPCPPAALCRGGCHCAPPPLSDCGAGAGTRRGSVPPPPRVWVCDLVRSPRHSPPPPLNCCGVGRLRSWESRLKPPPPPPLLPPPLPPPPPLGLTSSATSRPRGHTQSVPPRALLEGRGVPPPPPPASSFNSTRRHVRNPNTPPTRVPNRQ